MRVPSALGFRPRVRRVQTAWILPSVVLGQVP
jgi:hypothetical protein